MPASSQSIVGPLTESAIFLVVTVAPDGERVTRDLLTDLNGLRRSVGFRIPEAGLTCVAGIGADLWERLFNLPRPQSLHRFPGFQGAKHSAPATDGDLLFHIRAKRLDLCFELATLLCSRLDGVARVVDEVHGFRSFDERDLLGFVDGTENPEGGAASDATLIAAEDPDYAGGSYVVVQKYVHDMGSWNALSVSEQERVIGRTKLDDVEMADEIKPSNSHVALNTIVDQSGQERQILRFNMPFGRVGEGEFGTYFIGYTRSVEVIERMLTNMFVGDPPGNYDRILDFSTAVTGTLFFVPSLDFLDDPPVAAQPLSDLSASDSETASEVRELSEGTLGIASLREDTR